MVRFSANYTNEGVNVSLEVMKMKGRLSTRNMAHKQRSNQRATAKGLVRMLFLICAGLFSIFTLCSSSKGVTNGLTTLDECLACVVVSNLVTGVMEDPVISASTDEADEALEEKSLGAPLVMCHCWDGVLLEYERL
jgi:hypothetical protein